MVASLFCPGAVRSGSSLASLSLFWPGAVSLGETPGSRPWSVPGAVTDGLAGSSPFPSSSTWPGAVTAGVEGRDRAGWPGLLGPCGLAFQVPRSPRPAAPRSDDAVASSLLEKLDGLLGVAPLG